MRVADWNCLKAAWFCYIQVTSVYSVFFCISSSGRLSRFNLFADVLHEFIGQQEKYIKTREQQSKSNEEREKKMKRKNVLEDK